MAGENGSDSDDVLHRQLANISHSASSSIIPHDNIIIHQMTPESKLITTRKFTLPEDWFVKKVPRKSGTTIDKYYYDPETGRQFRSLVDVERYLTQGIMPTTTRSKSKMPNYQEKVILAGRVKTDSDHNSNDLLQKQDFEKDQDNEYHLINLSPRCFLSTNPKLPDGWIVKEVPRKSGDHIDRYYYEPGTERMFRSLTSVQKHLAQLEEENSPLAAVLEELRDNSLPLSEAFKLITPIKSYGSYDSWKKSFSRKEQGSSSSNYPPNKINWVISSTAGDTWNAFVGDELVPDFMKQQWGKRFMFTINDNNHNEQVFSVKWIFFLEL
ncbi:methyl-CpG-binding domain-containing protein 7-like [Bidens hawaiensis]|uniref:methyl-CpG-binding domain-containing protein 7-like n=1 Tax=Bidens hawaiensis TaxID=980011 RepID=UPI004049A396